MKRLEELIEIDEKFQNSINLQLDIDNLQKMEGYIPTRSSLSVREKFCNNILENKNFVSNNYDTSFIKKEFNL